MGTKHIKRTNTQHIWSIGTKRRRGNLTAHGAPATKYLQQIGNERPRHSCEMCDSRQGIWREKVVCLCEKCWIELKSLIGG
jgi:hypothetical protein